MTVIENLDLSKKSGEFNLYHGHLTLENLKKCSSIGDNPTIKELYSNEKCLHIVVCHYKDRQGDFRQRIAGMSRYRKDSEFVLECRDAMFKTLNFKPNLLGSKINEDWENGIPLKDFIRETKH